MDSNSNLRFLHLTRVDIEKYRAGDCGSYGMAWLLRFLSNFDASNKLEWIRLEVIISPCWFREACSAAGWGQVDCILAEKFQNLQWLGIDILTGWAGLETHDEIRACMADAHPLLVERGVEVEVLECGIRLW
jgi:hypothetical protein